MRLGKQSSVESVDLDKAKILLVRDNHSGSETRGQDSAGGGSGTVVEVNFVCYGFVILKVVRPQEEGQDSASPGGATD